MLDYLEIELAGFFGERTCQIIWRKNPPDYLEKEPSIFFLRKNRLDYLEKEHTRCFLNKNTLDYQGHSIQ